MLMLCGGPPRSNVEAFVMGVERRGQRPLGIPTVEDRVAQMVVVMSIAPRLEAIFHEDSYGYRPMRSAHSAIAKAIERCNENLWVLDMDISKFFAEQSEQVRALRHDRPRSVNLNRQTHLSIEQIAERINPIVSGWMNYYTRFGKSEFWKVTSYLNDKLSRWVKRKYKRFRTKFGKAYDWLVECAAHNRQMFSHWTSGYIPYPRLYKLK